MPICRDCQFFEPVLPPGTSLKLGDLGDSRDKMGTCYGLPPTVMSEDGLRAFTARAQVLVSDRGCSLFQSQSQS